MKYPVRINLTAWRDLEELYAWISEHDSVSHADYVLDQLAQCVESIATFPNRGSRPRELHTRMKINCRQVFFKSYRVIYEVKQTEVVIFLIADGRRNLQPLLMRRLAEG
jgi:toxin ParE1/3/4